MVRGSVSVEGATAGKRSGVGRSGARRVKMIFSVMASPNRIEILRILKTKGPLTYSELKAHAGFRSKKESGKFAYHLRKLHRQSLVALNKSERIYTVTNMGKLVLNLARQIEERSVIESGKMYVRTSRGSIEEFDSQRIIQSLVREGNLPLELAQRITEEVENRIYKYQTTYLTSALIRDMVNYVLLEHGHEDYRAKLVRVGLPVHDVQEMITNVDGTDGSDVEGMMLRAGQTVHAELLLTNNLSKDVTDAHLSGDLHITNPGLWSLLPDVIFLNMADMIVDGVNISDKRPDVSRMPAAADLDDLISLITMSITLAHKEASSEVVMDGLVSLLSGYRNGKADLGHKLARAFMVSSTTSQYDVASTAVLFRLQMGDDEGTVGEVLDAYRMYAERTSAPKIGVIIDYEQAGIGEMSERLAAIIHAGGRVAFAKGQVSESGITNGENRNGGMPSIHLCSVSINLPRLALDPSEDEAYFRTKLAILMKPVLEAMILRRRRVADLIRKGLNPLLAKNTRYMQRGKVSLVLNLVGLRESIFDILGYDDSKEGRATMYKVIDTAMNVARRWDKGGQDDIRICMTESDGAARLAALDGEMHGKRSIKVSDNAPYNSNVVIDASRIGDYSTRSEIISEANKLAKALNGGLLIDLEFRDGTEPGEIREAIEKAADLLPFFRVRVVPDGNL